MTKYVALLRGITPSKPNMRNDILRTAFEGLGLKNVTSVISSGNIIFETSHKDTSTLEKKIEQALYENLGLTSTTIIRQREDIQRLIESNPFTSYSHTPASYLTVTFLKTKQPKLSFPDSYSVVKVLDSEVCSVANTLIKEPDPIVWLEKHYGNAITTRTWNTVLKLHDKLS